MGAPSFLYHHPAARPAFSFAEQPRERATTTHAADPAPAACGVGYYSFATQSRERAAGLGAPALPYHHRRPACSFATHSRERATHHAADHHHHHHRLAPPRRSCLIAAQIPMNLSG